MDWEIIKSNRKTISVEIKRDGRLIVRAPMRMKKEDIDKFVISKQDWIEKHMAKIHEKNSQNLPKFTDDEIRKMAQKVLPIISQRAQYFAAIIGVRYAKITVRNQVSRWGSCSSKGNLNFNCLLALVPEDVLDYVVIHELCHLKQMNHSPAFWHEVEKVMPDYAEKRKWLRTEGEKLIARLR